MNLYKKKETVTMITVDLKLMLNHKLWLHKQAGNEWYPKQTTTKKYARGALQQA